MLVARVRRRGGGVRGFGAGRGGLPWHLAQGGDVEAVGLVRRYAAGRRVRVGEKALLLEVGHGIADGRRRQPPDVAARDGLGGLYVFRDDSQEHLAQALVEYGRSHGGRIVPD